MARASECKHLGIIIDSKLAFVNHITSFVLGGLSILGFPLRNSKWLFDGIILFLVFSALLRTKLEYGSISGILVMMFI